MIFLPLTIAHVDQVVDLQNSCFPDGWSKQSLLDGLESSNLKGITAFENDELLGFITYSVNQDFAELNDILVAPKVRRKGVANALMGEFIALLKGQTQKIFLEVRASNESAQALYYKWGFSKLSVRKKYYQDGEDALVLQKELL